MVSTKVFGTVPSGFSPKPRPAAWAGVSRARIRSLSANPGMLRSSVRGIGDLPVENDMFHGRQRQVDRAAAFVIGAVVAAAEFAIQSRGRLFHRDKVIRHVDDAADRAGAEEDRRRAANDFDALAQERADARRVIGAEIGDVENLRAIVQNPDAIVRLAANNGRLAPAVKPLPAMPGSFARVSPRLGAAFCLRLFSLRMVTDWALSVSLCSMAPPTTTTRSVSAVLAGVGEAAGRTASCAKPRTSSSRRARPR